MHCIQSTTVFATSGQYPASQNVSRVQKLAKLMAKEQNLIMEDLHTQINQLNNLLFQRITIDDNQIFTEIMQHLIFSMNA